jgi:hypothetical protein
MNQESLEQVLSEIDAYARRHGLSRTETAAAAGIPRTTFAGWFLEGASRRTPSPAMQDRLRAFLHEVRRIEGSPSGPDERAATTSTTTPGQLLTGGTGPGEIGSGVPGRGDASDTARRIRRVRHLLLLIEDELSAFRDGPASLRQALRDELDPGDVGYIASLLSMLGDESKFVRWRQLTTNRFERFRKKLRDD